MLSLAMMAPREHLFHKPAQSSAPPSSSTVSSRQQSSVPSSSQLSRLIADERNIVIRKANVLRFGAGWLRPPGVTKTLQSRLEEAQEQLDQLEMQRRDAEIRVQEEAAGHAGDATRPLDRSEPPDQEERDLDEDVPDAEPSTIISDDDHENTGNVTFHEESLQGSPDVIRQVVLAREDAELDGRLQDERDLGMEGDLDNDVPDVGSYEHTDTEHEDDSSDEDAIELQHPQSNARSPMRSSRHARRTLRHDASDVLADSSFDDTLPAILRRGARTINANPNVLARRANLQ